MLSAMNPMNWVLNYVQRSVKTTTDDFIRAEMVTARKSFEDQLKIISDKLSALTPPPTLPPTPVVTPPCSEKSLPLVEHETKYGSYVGKEKKVKKDVSKKMTLAGVITQFDPLKALAVLALLKEVKTLYDTWSSGRKLESAESKRLMDLFHYVAMFSVGYAIATKGTRAAPAAWKEVKGWFNVGESFLNVFSRREAQAFPYFEEDIKFSVPSTRGDILLCSGKPLVFDCTEEEGETRCREVFLAMWMKMKKDLKLKSPSEIVPCRKIVKHVCFGHMWDMTVDYPNCLADSKISELCAQIQDQFGAWHESGWKNVMEGKDLDEKDESEPDGYVDPDCISGDDKEEEAKEGEVEIDIDDPFVVSMIPGPNLAVCQLDECKDRNCAWHHPPEYSGFANPVWLVRLAAYLKWPKQKRQVYRKEHWQAVGKFVHHCGNLLYQHQFSRQAPDVAQWVCVCDSAFPIIPNLPGWASENAWDQLHHMATCGQIPNDIKAAARVLSTGKSPLTFGWFFDPRGYPDPYPFTFTAGDLMLEGFNQAALQWRGVDGSIATNWKSIVEYFRDKPHPVACGIALGLSAIGLFICYKLGTHVYQRRTVINEKTHRYDSYRRMEAALESSVFYSKTVLDTVSSAVFPVFFEPTCTTLVCHATQIEGRLYTTIHEDCKEKKPLFMRAGPDSDPFVVPLNFANCEVYNSCPEGSVVSWKSPNSMKLYPSLKWSKVVKVGDQVQIYHKQRDSFSTGKVTRVDPAANTWAADFATVVTFCGCPAFNHEGEVLWVHVWGDKIKGKQITLHNGGLRAKNGSAKPEGICELSLTQGCDGKCGMKHITLDELTKVNRERSKLGERPYCVNFARGKCTRSVCAYIHGWRGFPEAVEEGKRTSKPGTRDAEGIIDAVGEWYVGLSPVPQLMAGTAMAFTAINVACLACRFINQCIQNRKKPSEVEMVVNHTCDDDTKKKQEATWCNLWVGPPDNQVTIEVGTDKKGEATQKKEAVTRKRGKTAQRQRRQKSNREQRQFSHAKESPEYKMNRFEEPDFALEYEDRGYLKDQRAAKADDQLEHGMHGGKYDDGKLVFNMSKMDITDFRIERGESARVCVPKLIAGVCVRTQCAFKHVNKDQVTQDELKQAVTFAKKMVCPLGACKRKWKKDGKVLMCPFIHRSPPIEEAAEEPDEGSDRDSGNEDSS